MQHELSDEAGMALYTVRGALIPRPPFDFVRTLDVLADFTLVEGEQVVESGALTRALSLDGQVVVCRLVSTGDVESPRLEYTVAAAAPIDERLQSAAAAHLRFSLSLDDDLRPFYALARADPQFASLVERLYGYHQAKFLTPFHNACWAVLTQRTALPVGERSMQALADRFGDRLEVEGRGYLTFPGPVRLSFADLDMLAALVHNARQADYLLAVAAAFRDVDEGWLQTAPTGQVEAWLRGIRGIGAWSASFVLVSALGRMECIPSGYRRLALAVAYRYGLGHTPSDAEIARLAAPYGPWRGYWAQYLRVGSAS